MSAFDSVRPGGYFVDGPGGGPPMPALNAERVAERCAEALLHLDEIVALGAAPVLLDVPANKDTDE